MMNARDKYNSYLVLVYSGIFLIKLQLETSRLHRTTFCVSVLHLVLEKGRQVFRLRGMIFRGWKNIWDLSAQRKDICIRLWLVISWGHASQKTQESVIAYFTYTLKFCGRAVNQSFFQKENNYQTLLLGLVLKNFLRQVKHVFSVYATSPLNVHSIGDFPIKNVKLNQYLTIFVS